MTKLTENEMRNINGGFGFSIIPTYLIISRLVKIIRSRFR